MSNLKVFFIKSDNEVDTIEEAFLTFKSQQIQTVLCDVEEFINAHKQLAGTKTRIMAVTDKFSGDDFTKLKELENVRLVGPLCILACLNDGGSIPNCDGPLLNIAMQGTAVCCSNLKKADKARIKQLVTLMHGQFTDMQVANTTHLITDSVLTVKYASAAEKEINIMKPSWIDAIWMESQLRVIRYNDPQFEKHKCPVFYNLNICSTGVKVELLKDISALVNKHGGTYSNAMHLSKTDILICHGDKGSNSSKYKAVMGRRGLGPEIRCLTVQWIYDSIKKGCALPDDRYAVQNQSTPNTKLNKENEKDSELLLLSRVKAVDTSTASSTATMSNTFDATITDLDETKRNFSNIIDLSILKKSPTFLDGCYIYLMCFTGENLALLQGALKYTGATRLDTYSDRITHVVVGENQNDVSRQELRSLVEYVRNQRHLQTTHIVSMRWLADSIKRQTSLAEDTYVVSMELTPHSSQDMDGSPLSKKGLQLLRTDTSIRVQDTTKKLDESVQNNSTFKAPEELRQYMQTDETLARYFNDLNSEDLDGVNTLKNTTDQSNVTNDKVEKSKNQTDCCSFLKMPKKKDQRRDKSATKRKTSSISSVISMSSPENNSIAAEMDENDTVTLAFSNKTFQLLQFESEEMDELTTLINQLGGCVVSRTSGARSYRGITDYAVVPLFSDRKATRTVGAGHVLTDIWVRQCADIGQLVTVDYYHRCVTEAASNLFEGYVICTSAFAKWEQMYLSEVIAHLGGRAQGNLSRIVHVERDLLATTHLITNSSTKNKKYQFAKLWGLPVVNSRWAEESLRAGKRLPETDFASIPEEMDKSSVIDQTKKENFASPNPVTPRHDSTKKRMTFAPETPKFDSPAMSQPSPTQMSPVSQQYHETIERVKARVQQGLLYDSNCESPSSTRLAELAKGARSPDSPATPFSTKLLGPNATRADRKELRQFINQLPNNTPPTQSPSRRHSTPLSELKRRYIAKIDEKYDKECQKLRKEAEDRRQALDADQKNIDATDNDMFMSDENIDISSATSSKPGIPAHVIQEKMRNLSDMLSSGTPISNNKTTTPIAVTPVLGFSEFPDSQTYSVGWDYDVEVATTKPDVKERLFITTGFIQSEKEILQNKIKRLGAKLVMEQTKFDQKLTHLLCTSVSKNEKTLCSIAAGKWVLHVDYIEESFKAGHFLDEELFEFGNPKSNIPVDSKDVERARSAVFWRKTVSKTGKGAFHDMRAIVLSKGGPSTNIVESGGGTIIQSRPPYANNDYATHCLVEPRTADVSNLVSLAKCGIYCVPQIYLLNFLVNKDLDILQAVLPKLAHFYSK